MQSIVLQLRGLSLISCGASRNVQRLNIGQIALLGIYLLLGRFLLDGWLAPSPKIVINFSRTYEKLLC